MYPLRSVPFIVHSPCILQPGSRTIHWCSIQSQDFKHSYSLNLHLCNSSEQSEWIAVGELSLFLDNSSSCQILCERTLSLAHAGKDKSIKHSLSHLNIYFPILRQKYKDKRSLSTTHVSEKTGWKAQGNSHEGSQYLWTKFCAFLSLLSCPIFPSTRMSPCPRSAVPEYSRNKVCCHLPQSA